MEFWGAEVKAGKPFVVKPDEDTLIHISQASLGEFKGKKGESVPLFVKVGDQKLIIGTLSQENFPQISFDLVFEKEFELSHNCDKGSVHFIGYKSPNIDDMEEGDYFSGSEESEEEEEEEEVPALVTANGKPAAAVENAKANAVKGDTKPKAKAPEVEKNLKKPESEDDESDEEDESDEDDESGSEEGMDVDEDDSDDEEDSEEEEETPKKPEPINKKRTNESASKTPISAKKAKPAVTPQKTEEKKKGGHTATPHPAKKSGKSPVNANQSPKFGGQSSGGSQKKPFNNGKQFGSNNKGKRGGGK